MNLGEIIQVFRQQADDNASPSLWSDDEITRFANEAERDAVERGFLIEDDGNASAVVVTTTQGVTGTTAEVQTITVDATAGTFTVTYDSQTTGALAFNVSAAAMQTALEGLSNLVPGNVVVTLAVGVYTLTFDDALGNVSTVTVDDSLLTNPIVDIVVLAGKAVYTLDSRILKITSAHLDILNENLTATDRGTLDRTWRGDIDESGSGWNNAVSNPYMFIESKGKIRLVGIPTANDTLRLTVFRLPLADMDSPDDEPEIRVERHYELLDGMLARAYMKNDSETYNPDKSAEHEASFTRHFGAKIDANVLRKQRATRSHVTRINW